MTYGAVTYVMRCVRAESVIHFSKKCDTAWIVPCQNESKEKSARGISSNLYASNAVFN